MILIVRQLFIVSCLLFMCQLHCAAGRSTRVRKSDLAHNKWEHQFAPSQKGIKDMTMVDPTYGVSYDDWMDLLF